MSNVGATDIDGTIIVPILCVNGSSVPTAPDADPTYTVYDNAGTVVGSQTGSVTLSPGSNTGVYELVLTCSTGNGYASGGNYLVLAEWAISASARNALFTFHVQ